MTTPQAAAPPQQAPPPAQGTVAAITVAALAASPSLAALLSAVLPGVTAGMTRTQIRVLAMVLESIAEMASPAEAEAAVAAALSVPWRATRTAQTETSRAIGHGVEDTLRAGGVRAAEWLTADDERVCPACAANEDAGPVPMGTPFPSGVIRPPAHPNCLPAGTLVSARAITGSAERIFEGEFVTIRTAGGKNLTATANHPVLADTGWVAIGSLDESSYVISAGGHQRGAVGNKDDQHVPSRIEDVTETFRGAPGVGTVEVPISPEDFHGDGTGSDVCVVAAYSGLRADGDSAFGEHRSEEGLDPRDVRAAVGFLDGPRNEFGVTGSSAAHGGMGGTSERTAFLGGSPGHPHGHGLPAPAYGNAPLLEAPAHDVPADSQAIRDGLLAFAGEVTTDKVVGIDRFIARSHVYNLETVDGWYIANGIITHNCRCTTAPVDAVAVPGWGPSLFPVDTEKVFNARPPLAEHSDAVGKSEGDTAWIHEIRDFNGRWTKTLGLLENLVGTHRDSGYVPTGEEHAQLKDLHERAEALKSEIANPYYPKTEGGRDLLSQEIQLYQAVMESDSRRVMAAAGAAQERARGTHLDMSMFHGGMANHLAPGDLARFRELVNDAHLSYPDAKGEKWGPHGSPGYERAWELGELKRKAAQSMMTTAGVPGNAAWWLAGAPGAPAGEVMRQTEADPMTVDNLLNMWAASGGENAARVSAAYDKARLAAGPPDIHESDFAVTRKTETHTYTYFDGPHSSEVTRYVWDDPSPEAAGRRVAAAEYWAPRAQAYYTQQGLAELKRPPSGAIPVIRMVFDKDRHIRNAHAGGTPWQAATRSLSSWAEPKARAASTIEKFIRSQQRNVNPVWLRTEVPVDSVYMHWRTEGELRNSVKALGEVVPADATISNENTQVYSTFAEMPK